MSSFNQDEKWMQAKRVAGHLNWLEVISFYRSLEGNNVFVYSVIDGKKKLIIDILQDNLVLLLDNTGCVIILPYDQVLNSRKIFKYSEDLEDRVFTYGSDEYTIKIESHK